MVEVGCPDFEMLIEMALEIGWTWLGSEEGEG